MWYRNMQPTVWCSPVWHVPAAQDSCLGPTTQAAYETAAQEARQLVARSLTGDVAAGSSSGVPGAALPRSGGAGGLRSRAPPGDPFGPSAAAASREALWGDVEAAAQRAVMLCGRARGRMVTLQVGGQPWKGLQWACWWSLGARWGCVAAFLLMAVLQFPRFLPVAWTDCVCVYVPCLPPSPPSCSTRLRWTADTGGLRGGGTAAAAAQRVYWDPQHHNPHCCTPGLRSCAALLPCPGHLATPLHPSYHPDLSSSWVALHPSYRRPLC